MSEELDSHIKAFPSDFDGTWIARELRLADISVELYEGIRDRLWVPLQREIKDRRKRSRLDMAVINLTYDIGKAYDEFKELSGLAEAGVGE